MNKRDFSNEFIFISSMFFAIQFHNFIIDKKRVNINFSYLFYNWNQLKFPKNTSVRGEKRRVSWLFRSIVAHETLHSYLGKRGAYQCRQVLRGASKRAAQNTPAFQRSLFRADPEPTSLVCPFLPRVPHLLATGCPFHSSQLVAWNFWPPWKSWKKRNGIFETGEDNGRKLFQEHIGSPLSSVEK